jgi:hypothetical protein
LQTRDARWFAAVVCWVLFSSCANKELSRSEGQRISEAPARLIVVNSLNLATQVYLRPDFGGEVYLGRVSIGETKMFRIKPPFPPGRSFLVAVQTFPAWSGKPVIAELAESLTAGDTLHWDLQMNHLDWRVGTTAN